MKNELSYEKRIEKLKEEIEKLEQLVIIQKYFKKVEKLQNTFIVEMRRIIAEKMFQDGWTKTEIAKTLCRHHSSIIHLLKLDPNPDAYGIVKSNYLQWIEGEKYPYSVPINVPSYIHPQGIKTIVSCEVGNINELN